MPLVDLTPEEITQAGPLPVRQGGLVTLDDGFSPYAFSAAPVAIKPVSSDYGRGLGDVLPQAKALAGGAAALFGKTIGADSLKEWGLDVYNRNMAAASQDAKPTDDIVAAWHDAKDNGNIGGLIDSAQYWSGYGTGQALESVVAALAGGLVGSAVGPEGVVAGVAAGTVARGGVKALIAKAIEKEASSLVEKGMAAEAARAVAAKGLAKEIGVNAGLFANSAVQELGGIYPEAEQQATEEGRNLSGQDVAKIWGAGITAATVETVADRLGIKQILGPGGQSVTVRSALSTAMREVGAGAVREASTEGIQTGIERAGAGQSLTDDAAQHDYLTSMFAGAVGGGQGGVIATGRQMLLSAPKTPEQKVGEIFNQPDIDSAIAAAHDAVNSFQAFTPDPATPAAVQATARAQQLADEEATSPNTFDAEAAKNWVLNTPIPQVVDGLLSSPQEQRDEILSALPAHVQTVVNQQIQQSLQQASPDQLLNWHKAGSTQSSEEITRRNATQNQTIAASASSLSAAPNTVAPAANSAVNDAEAAQNEIAQSGGQYSTVRQPNKPVASTIQPSPDSPNLRIIQQALTPAAAVQALAPKDLPAIAANTALSAQEASVAQVLAKLTGKQVQFYRAQDAQGNLIRDGGFVNTKAAPNTVFVNVHAHEPLATITGHEVSHLIEQDHPEAYQAVADVARQAFTPEGAAEFRHSYGAAISPQEVEQFHALDREQGKPKRSYALFDQQDPEAAWLREAVGDLWGNQYQNPEFWTQVFAQIEQAHPDSYRSIIQRVSDAIVKMLNKILLAISGKAGFQEFIADTKAIKQSIIEATATAITAARAESAVLQVEPRNPSTTAGPRAYEQPVKPTAAKPVTAETKPDAGEQIRRLEAHLAEAKREKLQSEFDKAKQQATPQPQSKLQEELDRARAPQDYLATKAAQESVRTKAPNPAMAQAFGRAAEQQTTAQQKGDLAQALRARLHPEAAAATQTKYSKQVNPNRDDILTAIAKLGGLDRRAAESEGVDKAHFQERRGFGLPIFKKAGLSLDAMAESLSQHGYLPEDYTANELLDKVSTALSGKFVGTPEGYANQAETRELQRALDRNDDLERFRQLPDSAFLADTDAVTKLLTERMVEAIRNGVSPPTIGELIDETDTAPQVFAKLTALLADTEQSEPESQHSAPAENAAGEHHQALARFLDEPTAAVLRSTERNDDGWHALAGAYGLIASDDDLYRTPISLSDNLKQIFAETDPGIQVAADPSLANALRGVTGKRVDAAWEVKFPRRAEGPGGRTFTVHDTAQVVQAGREIWINASSLKEGVSGGNKLYAAVGNYAHNTGRVFIGDPLGLSDVAVIRRAENMLSLAVKFGSTEFLHPHPKQIAIASDSQSHLRGKVRNLDWRVGENWHNLLELLKTTYHNTLAFAPEIQDVRFNPATGKFTDAAGKPITAEQWQSYADAYRLRLAETTAGAGADTGGTARALPTQSSSDRGSATLKRAAFAHTLVREQSGTARRGFLAFLGGKLSGDIDGHGGVQYTELNQALYSTERHTTDTPEFRHWFGDSKVVDANGRPLVVYHGTRNDFTIFDYTKIGQQGRSEGGGFYFTTDKAIAEGYAEKGRVIEAYLKIVKPLAYDAKPFSNTQIRKLLGALARIESAKTGESWKDGFLSNYADTYSNGMQSSINEASKLFHDEAALDQIGGLLGSGITPDLVNEALYKSLGYDGFFAKGFTGKGVRGGDIWVASFPNQIKSATGNSGIFDTQNPDIRHSTDRHPFYSELSKAIDSAPAAKLTTGTAWHAWTKGGKLQQLGVKKDEVYWSGLEDWLALQGKNKVSADDVKNYLDQNGVKVTETKLGQQQFDKEEYIKNQFEKEWPDNFDTWLYESNREEIEKAWNDDSHVIWSSLGKNKQQYLDDAAATDGGVNQDEAREAFDDDVRRLARRDPSDLYSGDEWNYLRREAYDQTHQDYYDAAERAADDFDTEDSTKYSKYVVPGGTNYRELLLTLPSGVDEKTKALQTQASDIQDRAMQEGGRDLTAQELGKLTALRAQMKPAASTFQSSHFDQKNIVAHIRFDERKDADGKKVLFLIEAQSDWGQKGKRIGFKGDPLNPTDAEIKKYFDLREGANPADYRDEMVESLKKSDNRLPAAPFVTDTKAWVSLALKRTIAYAAEHDFDKVALINGEQAADLYDLSKQIHSIHYSNDDGKYSVQAWFSGKVIHEQTDMNENDLEQTFGKEVAQRIIDGEGDQKPAYRHYPAYTELSGDGLRIEATGMKEFYNAIVPQVAKDILRKNGGGEIHAIDIGHGDQQGFNITPSLREKVLSEGLPLFSTDRHSWSAPEPSRLDDVIYTMQDKHIDTKRIVGAIQATGKALKDAANPYLQEELFHGRAAKQTDDFVSGELKPLMTEMQARGITDPAEFEEYLQARHAKEANAQIAAINPALPDGGSGMTNREAANYLSALAPDKRKAYEALAKRVDAIVAKTRQTLVDYGLESQKTVNAWKATYAHYVPLNREDMGSGQGVGQGFSVKGPSSKRRIGSSRKVVDILANIALQRERAIVRGEKNRVALSLYGLAKDNPNTDFWRADTPPTIKTVDPRTNQVRELVDPIYKSRDNVVMARLPDLRTGEVKDVSVTFNEFDERAVRMAAALKNLDADQLGQVLGMMAKFTRYFAAVNTQYNPVFGAVNLMRDFQEAMINLTSTPLAGKQKEVAAYTLSALRGIYIDLRDHRAGKNPTSTWANEFEEFEKEGGKTGYRELFSNSAERAEALRKAMDPAAWTQTSWGKILTANGFLERPEVLAVDKVARPVFDWLSDYNEAMENAVRLSAYKVAKEQGLSKQQAASIAKNLTVNFNRKGQVALQAGAMYAFFNAAVQGTARTVQTLKGPAGKRIIQGGLALGAMQALMMLFAGFKDDEPPEFVRSRNFIIPVGDHYISIPYPLGFYVLPNTSRLLTQWALSGFKHTGDHVADLMGSFADAWNPIGNAGLSLQTIAPTMIDPLAALAENKDWTGKPIAKIDFNALKPTPGFTRAKNTATALSKELAYYLNAATGGDKYKQGLLSPTPDQIDYLIGQATGGVGREIGKTEQLATSAVTGEQMPLYKFPLLGRLVGETTGQSHEGQAFYTHLREINEHEAEVKGLLADHQTAELAAYRRDNPETRLIQVAGRIERRVGELNKQKRKLLAESASKERIRLIDTMITENMRQLNRRADQLSE